MREELLQERKKAIYGLICDELYVPMKAKEIAAVLNVPKSDRRDLAEVLDALVAEGKVEVSSKGKYMKSEGKFLTGVFTAHPRGFGFVTVEGEDEDIFIPESQVNGAFHGDTVQVALTRAEGHGRRREGQITKILTRGVSRIVCTYEKSKTFGFAVPDNPRFGQDIFIPQERSKGAVSGHKVVVELTDFGGNGKKPEGKVVEILGHVNDPGTDILSIVRGYDLPTEFPETKIILDAQGRPVEIKPYERNVATKIIEDFMLLANETVAQDYFWQELPFVYRTHENPDTKKIHKLATFINNFGYSIHIGQDEVHPKELQKLLLRIDGTPEEALISRLTLRSMKQAKYSTVNTGHFGLATSYYCHFTSPIRRYPDLQIHRIIKDNLRGRMNAKRIEHYEKILPEVAKHSSEMERRADEAERECDKLKKVQYMSGHLGEEFWGVISGVTEWGFYVELPNTVEGLVHVTTLTDDYFHYSESTYELIGETTAKRYKLGQKVKVVVAATDPFMRTIDFRVVTGIEDEENEKLNQKFIAE